MSFDDDDLLGGTVVPRAERRDTRPLLRTALLVASPGVDECLAVSRLREIARERELYVERLVLRESTEFRELVAAHGGTVFVATTEEPAPSTDELRAACEQAGVPFVLARVGDEREIRASVRAIEDAILQRIDGGAPADPVVPRRRRGVVCLDAAEVERALAQRSPGPGLPRGR